MECLAVLTHDYRTQNAARRELAGVVRMRFCNRPEKLRQLLRRINVDAVLIDATYFGTDGSFVAFLRSLSDDHPKIVLILCIHLSPHAVHSLLPALLPSVAGVAVLGHDRLVECLHGSQFRVSARSDERQVARAIRAIVPTSAGETIDAFVAAAAQAGTVVSLANGLAVSQRTLLRRLRSWGLPGAAELLSWIRVLLIARRLQTKSVTVESAASTLKFSSASALRRATQRHAGLSPSQLRDARGEARLLDAFQQFVSAGKS